MQTKLGSWSWQQLHAMYKIYAEQMEGYADIAERFELPLPVKRINAQLKVLDREIARRNKLIGFMG